MEHFSAVKFVLSRTSRKNIMNFRVIPKFMFENKNAQDHFTFYPSNIMQHKSIFCLDKSYIRNVKVKTCTDTFYLINFNITSHWTWYLCYFNRSVIALNIIQLMWGWHVITSGIMPFLGTFIGCKEHNTSYLSEILL